MSVRSERDVARRARDVAIRIPRRTATVLTILLVAIAVLVVIFGLAAIAAANAPRSLAGSAEMRIQQTAAEKAAEVEARKRFQREEEAEVKRYKKLEREEAARGHP